ncbi:hypothetical protein UA42_15690 [Photobacterium kishitanii]|uniref:hypothetical protein n=1 Tax=Photobacterium kishitanii TaxID=318456 RepID=UPI0005D2E382|nr:hypothetical protein [Photobacterium kishitanii]KJG60429.1 hypothetical protein UA42_15690 [Photobacterium kishitanii]
MRCIILIIFYQYTMRILKIKKYDILKCYQVNEKLLGLVDFHTLHIDLNQPIDSIFSSFSQTTRNEVKRNINKDEVDYIIVEDVSVKELDDFMLMFQEFVKFKNLDVDIDNLYLSLKRNLKNIVFFKGVFNDEIIVFNIYLKDSLRARLKCSVSIRSDDKVKRNLIGRTNRGICFKAIEYFKDKGYSIFDLGGISLSDDKDKKNIDSFKSKFGGVLITEYEGNIPLSLKAKMVFSLYDIIKKLK